MLYTYINRHAEQPPNITKHKNISPIATSKKHKQKKRKRGNKITDEKTSPDLIGEEGKKQNKSKKNKSKDPPRISERQLDKQARQTKSQDHTTVDTVRESLSSSGKYLDLG